MNNFLDPAILFFLLGILAGLVRSNLEIPPAIARFLSLYLLMALGLKGGFALAHSGITTEVASSLGLAVFLAIAIPLLSYRVLRRLTEPLNAVAIAATYGSVSAVTFVTTVQFLERQHIAYGGHMAAAMALMESPAILLAVFMANGLRHQQQAQLGQTAAHAPMPLRTVLHESLTDGSQVVLLGAMAVGLLSGEEGKAAMQPFSGDLFKGMLAFFLLDMGLLTARNLPLLKSQSRWLLAYAAVAPWVHAAIALVLARLLGLNAGDTTLIMVLSASASYIAVPAVLRYAIPEASASIYVGLSLGVTFPMNILVGIPTYAWLAQTVAR
ncbi:sodium-dependent bicarbonate transport family permease [Curvibacter sp. CHRR-16]|uniref:sodium-dependent bicarbonate transport family permease n=1 Tax=Curvibacter sp. CHRR-16 TaxID=2835872 RepID=UPI001BD96376|nr:sodium-dependent bicarbonate transport family permease [Curvibacter sp. CHRR-16]MBT0570763.1 sodium-dependent bicarbonate transport family permease [Curvibacter sp. CHRR-16]